MLLERLQDYHLILASGSPRRQRLMAEAGFHFDIVDHLDADETYPGHLHREEIATFIAEKKSEAYVTPLEDRQILITADTIVWQEGHVLHKPAYREEAVEILRQIADNEHEVYTGVCLRSTKQTRKFFSVTKVVFDTLSDAEIDYYVTHFAPYDKAGAYGIQEWIGYVGVEEIHGSYFNVMGMPVHTLYRELERFIDT